MKSNKGFTLIELLAVIVVLAIIMVIATTQINSTIKKSRIDSLMSSLDMVVNQTKKVYVQYGEAMTEDNVKENIDYNKKEYEVSLSGNQVCVETVEGGKFESIKATDIDDEDGEILVLTQTTTNPGGIQKKDTVLICKDYK